MSCSYADIATAYHDRKVLSYFVSPTTCKKVQGHGTDTRPSFLDYLNNVNEAGKIKFTVKIADQEKCLEFLNLRIKSVKGKLSVDVFSEPTNSFTYVKPTTCYPRKNINNVPRGIALILRWICDIDRKIESHANEYKKYLIARDYKRSLVNKQFQEVSKLQEQKPDQRDLKTTRQVKLNF